MAVLVAPEVGARSPWMRNALLVMALAGAGEAGAEDRVPGSSLAENAQGGAILRLQG